ncbi:MAG: cbb3-type cytochrome c oxidase subunit I [Calditrichia bacterium]
MLVNHPVAVEKTRIDNIIDEDFSLTRLVYAYVAFATFWLVFGTLVGEYLGIRLAYPDWGVAPWLSFGRLRPIHTNVVFWGWASLGMLALSLYVVPRTSQKKLHSIPLAWITLALINISVVAGVFFLFNGVNNGAQEYREFIWPVTAVFATAVILMAYNLYQTVARRSTKEIYISNWYILGALFWTITLVVIAYLPWYQHGLGETVVQGYYMHMGVGMWFTPMVLGLTYYFIPKLLNKPIYSYSLGVLAFWTQMVFYSLIGAHHFVFSPIPWWLQTVGIIFSVGMFIPVFAGTGNFLLTMRGSGRTIARSYSLPFILVGVIYYFVASGQGTFEAFRSTNKIWHFTNFTIAHSHMTMFGFITFLIWGGIYGLIPRLTGKEPPHLLIGIHFWFALVGVLIYGFALMIGGTEQGQSWVAGAPFIKSVELMAPYWLWRAIGGTLMFFSHLVFAFNVWRMRPAVEAVTVTETEGAPA